MKRILGLGCLFGVFFGVCALGASETSGGGANPF